MPIERAVYVQYNNGQYIIELFETDPEHEEEQKRVGIYKLPNYHELGGVVSNWIHNAINPNY